MVTNGMNADEILKYFTQEGKSLISKFEYLNGIVAQTVAAVKKDVVEKVTEKVAELSIKEQATPSPVKKEEAPKEEKDEDDIDLFGSDDEVDEEAEKLKQQRLAEYAAKKAAKPAVIAKSQVILDVKPWDDETPMDELEKSVRSIEMDGLVLGNSKLVPVGFGIKKLQIATVIEDAKVSVDDLIDKICEFEDYVQSVDVAAFNKL